MGEERAERIRVRNPRTGEIDTEIGPPSQVELSDGCAALRLGQSVWEAGGLDTRVAVMLRWADAIEDLAEEIGAAEEIDTGRRRVAHEVPFMVAGAVRGWCEQAPRVFERARLNGTSSVSDSVVYDTEFDPYPLVGVISPWNHPFLLSTLDAIPALLAGCAVIVKPSEITPRFVDASDGLDQTAFLSWQRCSRTSSAQQRPARNSSGSSMRSASPEAFPPVGALLSRAPSGSFRASWSSAGRILRS